MYNLDIREKVLWFLIIFASVLVISTEILSYFNLLERKIIISMWILIFLFGFLFYFKTLLKKKVFKLGNYYSLNIENFFLIISIILIVLLTFLISLTYPPNTPDGLSYHMPRVMQWIQNKNVNFYPTSDTRQLYLGPFSGFVIMHFMFLVNSDFLSNLVQWFAMVFCIMNVSLITKKLGGNLNTQLISALFCATIPMGILQSTGTQTDYVVSLWILSIVFFLISYLIDNKKKNVLGFAISLSLAILTKQTAYFFALPFCIWLFIYILKSKPKHFKYLFFIPLIILIINFGHYTRTYKTFGNPISSDNLGVKSEIINLQSISSNIVRNISLNMSVPNAKINETTRNLVKKFHSFFKIDPNDKRTTIRKYYIYFSLKEKLASNTLHFLILILCITLFLLKKNFYQKKISYYFISLLAGFILFSALLKWQPYGNRLLLPIFVLSSPLVGLILSKFKNKFFLIIIPLIMFLYCLPYLLMNDMRPLIKKVVKEKNYKIRFIEPDYKNKIRKNLYSTGLMIPKYDVPISQLSEFIKKLECETIGFISTNNSMEYLFWIFLKDNTVSNTKIYYLDVKNKSSKNYRRPREKEVCAIIKNFRINEDNSESIKKSSFRNKQIFGDYVLYF